VTLPDVRGDFPILTRQARGGRRLNYLDSAATSHQPEQVLEAQDEFIREHYGAVGRGAHLLAEEATEAVDSARRDIARFVGADAGEIVWAANATSAINLVAAGIGAASQGIGGVEAGRFALAEGDEIVVTQTEHHANLIPWQILARRAGAALRWIPLDNDGRLGLDDLAGIVGERTKVVAFQHASNVTGVIHPVSTIVERAHAVGALTVLDACQSVPHLPIDFPALGVDFAAFSAHKMLGPTGIGALYGRRELLDTLPPAVYGGSTVKTVTMTETTWLDAPAKFEAGSQPVVQAVGFGAAVRYLSDLGREDTETRDRDLAERLRRGVSSIEGVRLLGPIGGADEPVIGLAAVHVEGVHPHDVGQVLDDAGIAVRVGHHCAQPLHVRLGVPSSTRASTQVYTTDDDIDEFLEALDGVRGFFKAGGSS